jgi:DICT domain-containing protein
MSVSGEELSASTEEEILTLDRVLDPVSRCLTPEVARRIVELRADPELQKRVDMLADRSAEGQLTPEERAEYETYVRASRFIAILQAKARKLLARHPSS